MSYYPTFTRAEGAAYYRFADMMRKLEWEIHHKFWRGEGLPEAWHEIATDHGPGPKERITLWVDKRTVKFFRATGKGWQTRMNLVLVAYAEARASGAVKGAERFRLDRSAEKHEVDGPPPGWGQTKAEEAALEAQFDEICNRPTPWQAAPEVASEPMPEAAPAPDATPDMPPEMPPDMAQSAPELAPEPGETPPGGPADAAEPAAAPAAGVAPEADPEPAPASAPAAPPDSPPRKLTRQEYIRQLDEERAAAGRVRSAAISAERPGEAPLERQERLKYHMRDLTAKVAAQMRKERRSKDIPPEWQEFLGRDG